MTKHVHHNDLVKAGYGAYLSCGSITSAITGMADDNGWPQVSDSQLCAIMTDVHKQVRS